MRILLTGTRGAGHIGPLVPFALACKRAGHDVLIAAPHSAWAHVARARLPFAGVDDPPAAVMDGLWQRVRACEDRAQADRIVLEEAFVGAFARAAYPAMLALVRRWRPDVILRETLEFASLLAAEAVGVPALQVECFLAAPEELAAVDAPLERLRSELGVRERAHDPRYLTLSPRALDSPRPGALRFRVPRERTEPLPAWWPGLNDAPLIYVSFGSAAAGNGYYPALYRTTVDALEALDARVLLTLGIEVDPAALGPLPRNVHVERWVPQARVMPEAAVMVGHGGSGSTLAALAAGVPLAVLPLFADQDQNARRVAALGAGLRVERVTAKAVRALLDDPAYWLAAQKVQLEVAGHAPIADVVPLLRQVASPGAIAA
jgi:UDP:flavonoid glycosyltransferase YjiC (YdhE family)